MIAKGPEDGPMKYANVEAPVLQAVFLLLNQRKEVWTFNTSVLQVHNLLGTQFAMRQPIFCIIPSRIQKPNHPPKKHMAIISPSR